MPEGKTAKAEFYIAKKWNHAIEKHLADHDAPYLKPWSVDLPAGISKLEVVHTAIDETPKNQAWWFAKFTPILGVKLDGNSIFSESIPGFSHVGSNGGWKPDAKSQLVLGAENSHQEFATFRYAEVPDKPIVHNLRFTYENEPTAFISPSTMVEFERLRRVYKWEPLTLSDVFEINGTGDRFTFKVFPKSNGRSGPPLY